MLQIQNKQFTELDNDVINNLDLWDVFGELRDVNLEMISNVNDVLLELKKHKQFVSTNSRDGFVNVESFFLNSPLNIEVGSYLIAKALSREESLRVIEMGDMYNFSYCDNTSNYLNMLDHDFSFSIFENMFNKEIVVFFKIHWGLDIMRDYTNYFAYSFKNKVCLQCMLSNVFIDCE